MDGRSTSWLQAFDRHAGWIAAICCVPALLGFAAALPAFSHVQHPPGLLGAVGVPRAPAFNLLAFVVPGLLAAWVFARLRERLPRDAGRMAGIAPWLLAISALAFGAQGLFPLDPIDLDGPASQRHATSWMLWWLSFAPGAVLLGFAVRRAQGWAGWGGLLIAAGTVVIVLNAMPAAWLPGPIAQRALLALWLVCVWSASRRG